MCERENVIKGLECRSNNAIGRDCENCPYGMQIVRRRGCDFMKLAYDALKLLKAQEPRVMTLDEVKQHNNQDGCVWFEQPTYNADAAFVIKEDFMTQVISPYILGAPINRGYWTNGNYGKTWRCWTSRPTDEQREATPWDG